MGTIKPNKEIIINEILAELDFGTSYKDCLALNAETWQLPERTFCRYWKEAKAKYEAKTSIVQKALDETRAELVTTRLKSRILDKYERMEILSEIARGEIIVSKPMVVDGVIQEADVRPDWQSRKAAINELNKMDGSHEPTKKDITSKGESLNASKKLIIKIPKREGL